jgi:phosphate-selective porin OprO and OprP
MTRPVFLSALSVCALAFARVQAAEPTSVEERLLKLESTVQSLTKENEQLKKQLGFDGKGYATLPRPAGKETKLQLGGMLQAQGEFGDATDPRFPAADRFLLRRARLYVQGEFAEHFDFKLEGEYAGGGASNRVQLVDGYLTWMRHNAAMVRAGQFKTPFGHEQLAADPRLPLAERTLSNDRLTLNRQLGVALSGDFFEKRLSYSAGVFNGNGANNGSNDNDAFIYVGRVAGIAYAGEWAGQKTKLTVGANAFSSHDRSVAISGFNFDSSAAAGIDNIFSGEREGRGIDVQLSLGRFEFLTEYLTVRFQPANGNFTATPADDRFNSTGWYALAGYHIVPKKLQAVLRFEEFDINDRTANDRFSAWTGGINYFIRGDDLKLLANYMLSDPAGPLRDRDRLLVRMQLLF